QLNIKSFSQSRRTLINTALLILSLGVFATVIFSLIPGFLLSVFGNEYVAVSYLLWKLGFVMTVLALLTVILQVSALYNPVRTLLICAFGFIALMVSVAGNHETPERLVSTILLVFATILSVGIINLYWTYHSEQK